MTTAPEPYVMDNRIGLDYIQSLRRLSWTRDPPGFRVWDLAARGHIRGWVPGACPWDGWWVDEPDLGDDERAHLRLTLRDHHG